MFFLFLPVIAFSCRKLFMIGVKAVVVYTRYVIWPFTCGIFSNLDIV